MLYCVINKPWGDIIGRFKTYSKAIQYLKECFSNGVDVELKAMTKEEYLKYTEKLLKTY